MLDHFFLKLPGGNSRIASPSSSISHTRFSTNGPGLWALASGALGSARPLSSVQCECRRWTAAPCVGAGAPQAAGSGRGWLLRVLWRLPNLYRRKS